jgi:hypothetical protein
MYVFARATRFVFQKLSETGYNRTFCVIPGKVTVRKKRFLKSVPMGTLSLPVWPE